MFNGISIWLIILTVCLSNKRKVDGVAYTDETGFSINVKSNVLGLERKYCNVSQIVTILVALILAMLSLM